MVLGARHRCDRLQSTVGSRPCRPSALPCAPPSQQSLLRHAFVVCWVNYYVSSMIVSCSRCEQVIAEIAQHHHVDPAAVVLRWLRQHGCVVLPKSLTPHRIADNLMRPRDFVLSEKEMDLLVRATTSKMHLLGPCMPIVICFALQHEVR